ncbi:DUF58 domain-containing protein [Candidatus Dependentiae bacterium]
MFGIKNNNSNKFEDDIRNKIKKIKIFTKRLMKSSIIGDYLSAFKGTGFEFDQLKEYQMGDDIRFIDWNSSAKMNKIIIKKLVSERDRTVILVIDISKSCLYSSQKNLRKDMIAQVATALAFVAAENKDRVGALFFSDKVERWIPPSRGKLHLGKIIETIFSMQATNNKTNIFEALNFLVSLKKRNAIVFMLSDWIDDSCDYSKILKVAGYEYDFVGIRFLDLCEKEFPDVGYIDLQDLETKKSLTINSSYLINSKEEETNINLLLRQRYLLQKRMFEKYRIDLLDLVLGKSFINPMIHFFRKRTTRQI